MDTKSILVGIIGGVAIGVLIGSLVLDRGTQAMDMTVDGMTTETDKMVTDMDEMTMDMQPEPVEVVDEAPVPAIEIVSATRDAMGAYSVLVETTDFTFTPENIDGEPVSNEGHTHVYVDGVKVGREYAPWIYVPASYFSGEGPYEITVTLNANTHGEWTLLGAPIAASVIVE